MKTPSPKYHIYSKAIYVTMDCYGTCFHDLNVIHDNKLHMTRQLHGVLECLDECFGKYGN